MGMEEILAQADYLMHVAVSKCDSWDDAQDIVQNTLLEGMLALKKGTQINNAKNWLCTVLNRKYYDLLREKYRKPLVFFGTDFEAFMEKESAEFTPDTDEELSEAENIRRLVAGLTGQYREIIVKHYFHGQGVKEIAEKLSLPENTVKSRLRLGRDRLRKELTMEKYEKQSYEPENLWISSSGCGGDNGEPYSLVKNDRITMNLLILAYEKPVSIPELADAIGISTTYIEPIVERLVGGELMKKTGDKVYTDFIIYTEKDITNTFEIQKQLATDLWEDLWKYIEEGLNTLRNKAFYKKQNPAQAVKLEGYFVLHSVYRAVIKVRDEVSGTGNSYDYPLRKAGGRWYAMGSRYPADYDYDNSPVTKYGISGEAGGVYEYLPGAKKVGLYDYDTDALGKTHSIYSIVGDWMASREIVTKFLYAVYRNDERMLSGISAKAIENINAFEELDFVERLPEGKLKLNVPVLTLDEKNDFYELMNEYRDIFATTFHDEFLKMIKNPTEVPKQIKQDVPEFLRYIHTCCYFPSALIYELREHGKLFKDCKRPVSPVFMFVEPE